MRSLFLIPLILNTFLISGQDFSNKVTALKDGESSPPAKIEDVSWIAGHWRGDALGGVAEEIWSKPAGGAMMASFRLVKDEKVVFYELITLLEENNTLILRLKHFNSDLTGWEEKAESVEFKLVEVKKSSVLFEGFTIEKEGPDKLNMYVLFDESEGKKQVGVFKYDRVVQ